MDQLTLMGQHAYFPTFLASPLHEVQWHGHCRCMGNHLHPFPSPNNPAPDYRLIEVRLGSNNSDGTTYIISFALSLQK